MIDNIAERYGESIHPNNSVGGTEFKIEGDKVFIGYVWLEDGEIIDPFEVMDIGFSNVRQAMRQRWKFEKITLSYKEFMEWCLNDGITYDEFIDICLEHKNVIQEDDTFIFV